MAAIFELAAELLKGFYMRVADRMTPNPCVVRLGDSLATARTIMLAERFKHLPVVERKRVLGLITERDIRAHANELDNTMVETVMTTGLETASPDDPIEHAASLMLTKDIGCLPVIEHGSLVGIITTTDMLRALLDLVRLRTKES